MNQKHQPKMYHANININLMVKNVIQIKIRITINIDVSAKFRKNIMCAKKIIFRNLVLVFGKMVSFQEVLLLIQ